MGLFSRIRGSQTPRHGQSERKPTRAERQAAERTARAEAKLTQTEEQIHQLADEMRHDLK